MTHSVTEGGKVVALYPIDPVDLRLSSAQAKFLRRANVQTGILPTHNEAGHQYSVKITRTLAYRKLIAQKGAPTEYDPVWFISHHGRIALQRYKEQG